MTAHPQQADLFGKASTRPCTTCKKHFVGIGSTDTLCPQCEKVSDFYRRSRQKGDPLKVIPYAELFCQWKNRRKECREWRKAAELAANDRMLREQAELNTSFLLAALLALDGSPDLDILAALGQAKADVARLEAERDLIKVKLHAAREEAMNARLNSTRSWANANRDPAIPVSMWRRLVQLCHPDKHGGSEVATNAMQWLNQVRP